MSASPRSCVHLSPIVSPHVCLCWMVCPPSQGLVSPRLPLSRLVSPCLALSPIVSHMCACVGWRVRLPEVLCPLVSHCLPTCVPVLDGVSAFPRSCLPLSLVSPCLALSPIVSPHVCLRWMVCPPSRGLVFPCLPLSPLVSHCLPLWHMCACVGWCVRLPEALSPLVSPHVCLYWMLCPPSQRLVPFLPLSPIVSPHMCACVGWCVRLPEVLSPLVSHCGTCAPVLEGVFAFPRSCLPSVSLHMCACVGWCVCLRKFLSSLVPHCLPMPPIALIASHCLPTCVPVLDGVFAFPRCACVGWCVRIPELLSPLATHCLPWLHMCACGGRCARLPQVRSYPLSPRMCPCVSWCIRLPEVLSPLVSPPMLDGVFAFLRSCLPCLLFKGLRLTAGRRPSNLGTMLALCWAYVGLCWACVGRF